MIRIYRLRSSVKYATELRAIVQNTYVLSLAGLLDRRFRLIRKDTVGQLQLSKPPNAQSSPKRQKMVPGILSITMSLQFHFGFS